MHHAYPVQPVTNDYLLQDRLTGKKKTERIKLMNIHIYFVGEHTTLESLWHEDKSVDGAQDFEGNTTTVLID